MLAIIGILSVVGVFYAYFGYPMVLLLLAQKPFNKKNETSNQEFLGVSIVVTCRNEEAVINDKLENTLSILISNKSIEDELKSSEPKVQVIVASDASDDSTHDIVNTFSARGVELVAMSERRGKESTQKAALNSVKFPIVIFTDAKVFLQADSVNQIIKCFNDPTVGAVSSRDKVVDEYGKSGEGAYVAYEMWIRKVETQVYSLAGLSGSCFAVRKSVTSNFPENVPSDFCMLIEARKQGMRGVHADNVIAEYRAVASDQAEFERKVRTVVRGMRSVWLYRNEIFRLNDKTTDRFLAFQIFSHKICRWLVPFFVIGAFLSSLVLCMTSMFWMLLFLGCILLFGLSGKGLIDPASRDSLIVKLCFFFVLTNLGILYAWLRFLTGDSQVIWNPSNKG